MLSAAYAAMFANGRADHISAPPDCSTGNCTWSGPYVTLGVCSKCYDITSSIQQQCVEYDSSDSMRRNANSSVDRSIQYKDINCTYSLPNGLAVTNKADSATTLQVLGFVPESPQHAADTIHFSELQTPLAIMVLLNATMGDGDARLVSPVLQSSLATECALQYCVKKYNGSVSLGKLDETLIDTFYDESAQFEDKIVVHVEGTHRSDKYLTLRPPTSWLANANHTDTSFGVCKLAHQNLQLIFASSDTCTETSSAVSNCPQTIFDGNVYASSEYIKGVHDIPKHIYRLNFTGIETMMENVALGFTSAMRTSKSAIYPTANAPFQGEARVSVVIAHVRWGWITAPTTLLVLTLIFMLLTAWETRRRGAMLWKGSSLPAFYYPLTSEGRSQLTEVAGPRELENTASAMKVRWQMTENGMRLVKVD